MLCFFSEGITPAVARAGCAVAGQPNSVRDGIPVKQEGDKPDWLPRDVAVQPATSPRAVVCLHLFAWNWDAWPAQGVGCMPAGHRGLPQGWHARAAHRQQPDIGCWPLNQNHTPTTMPATTATGGWKIWNEVMSFAFTENRRKRCPIEWGRTAE